MNKLLSIGLAIALVLVCGGAWYLYAPDDGGVIPINIFTTYSIDGSYSNNTASFVVDASKDNVTIDGLDLYISYDDGETFTKASDLEDITLPETIEILVNENETTLTYYAILTINDGLESSRLPKTVDTYYTLDVTTITIEDDEETNETAETAITFATSADFSNVTNITVITLSADSEINETIQANLFTSLDNITFNNVENKTATALPLTFDVEKGENDTTLYYYMDVIFQNVTSQIPESAAVVALE